MNKIKILVFTTMHLALAFFRTIHPVFVSRYVVPDPFFSPILSYRSQSNTINVQPFIMTAGEAHISKHEITTKSRRRLGEMGEIEILDMQKINKSIKRSGLSIKNHIPSEWLGYGMPIQMHLGGKNTGAGLSWNINKNIVKNFSIGWESGIFSSQSAISLDAKVPDESFILKEGFLFDIFSTYENLTKTLKLSNLYEKRINIIDQNIYARYTFEADFIAHCKRIKGIAQLGCIIPTSGKIDIKNPASIAVGTNGHLGFCGSLELDFLLKEDISLGFKGSVIGQKSEIKNCRLPYDTEQKKYGTIITKATVSPGTTISFSPYLSIEGLRDGLGLRLAYNAYNHLADSIKVHDKTVNYNKFATRTYSQWAQEHMCFAAFFDFTRKNDIHSFEPFIGLNVHIPVNFFFSNNSARCYSISCIFEVLF
jgi:hypothetical protein